MDKRLCLGCVTYLLSSLVRVVAVPIQEESMSEGVYLVCVIYLLSSLLLRAVAVPIQEDSREQVSTISTNGLLLLEESFLSLSYIIEK